MGVKRIEFFDTLFLLILFCLFTVLSLFVILIGAHAYSGVVQGWLDQISGAAPAAGRFGRWVSELSAALSGGDMMVVALAYTVVTLLILGSGTWMTLRYVNSD